MSEVSSQTRSVAGAAPGGDETHAGRRIVRNSTLNMLGQGLLAASHLGVVVVLARVLGKDGLGVCCTAFALVFSLQLLLEVGLHVLLTQRIAQGQESWRQHVAEGAGLHALSAAASLAVFLVPGLAWAVWHQDASLALLALGAGVACAAIQVQRFANGVFRAFEQLEYENITRALHGLLFLGLTGLLVLCQVCSPATVLAMFAASHVVAAVVLVVGLQRRWHCLGWSLSWSVVGSWFREAIPLGLGDVARRLTWQLDTILLALLQPAAAVGIYSVAYRPLSPLSWLPQAVMTALFPTLARLAARDRQALAATFDRTMRLMWVISLPLAVPICVGAEPIVRLLAGPAFLAAAVPMRILIWVAVLVFLSRQLRFLFTAVGQQHLFARLAVAVLLLEVVLELALIPAWGYLGACAGTVVGELIFTTVGLWLCRRVGIGAIKWRPFGGAAIAAAAMAALSWPVRDSALLVLVPALCGAGVVYLLLCFLFGSLKWEEVVYLSESLFRKMRKRRSPDAVPGPARQVVSSEGVLT